jgi:hypothetical protein
MRTDVAVPDDLSGMSRADLTALRDRLIAAGCQVGGIDDRLKEVAEALRSKNGRRRREDDGRKKSGSGRPKRKRGFQFGSLGSVAGDKLAKLKEKSRNG